MRKGEEYEALVEQLIAALVSVEGVHQVERDVRVQGLDGLRQIDVLVRTKVGPFDLTMIVECKDTERVVVIGVIDEIESKMRDVGANKAVVVTRRGFSKTARQKAKRCGIKLLLANQLHLVKDLPFELPVHLRSFQLTGLRFTGNVSLQAGQEIDSNDLIALDGRDLLQEAREYALSLPHDELEGTTHDWTPEPPDEGWLLPTSLGDIQIVDLGLTFELVSHHRFGYLTDLTSVLYMRDVLQAEHRFLIPAECLLGEMFEAFARFDNAADLPASPVLSVSILEMGEARRDQMTFSLRRTGPLLPGAS